MKRNFLGGQTNTPRKRFIPSGRRYESPEESRTPTLNADSQNTIVDICTPGLPSPLICLLVGSDIRASSLPHTVTTSLNQTFYRFVCPFSVPESESGDPHISDQRLKLAKPRNSDNTSKDYVISVEEDEITVLLPFAQHAAIRIEHEAIHKNKVKRTKAIFNCKTCSLDIISTLVTREIDCYNSYQQNMIGQKHNKKLDEWESFYCNVCKISSTSKHDCDGHLEEKAHRVKNHNVKQKMKHSL